MNLHYKLTNINVFLTLLGIGTLVFGNALFNGFLGDDIQVVFNNSLTIPLPDSFRIFIYSQTDTLHNSFFTEYYRPVSIFYFAIIKSILGYSPFFFRFPIILIHIINSFLIFLLLSRHFNIKLSFAASLVFLVHPINQESAVYIAVAQDIFNFFFGIIGLLLLTKKDSDIKIKILSSLFFLLAILSKETGALFLIMGAAYIIFFSKRQLLTNFLVLLAPALVYITMRFLAVGNHSIYIISSTMSSLSLMERALSMPKIFSTYLIYLVHPTNVSIIPQWAVEQINFWDFLLPIIIGVTFLILSIIFFFILRFSNKKLSIIYFLFFIWFILGIGLHLQIFPLDQTIARRWFYFPFVGILGMSLCVSEYYRKPILKYKNFFLIVFIIVLFFFAGKTITRNADFHSAINLYQKDITNSENYILENNLGDELFRIGEIEKAETHLKRSIAINPEWSVAWTNLGVIEEKRGNPEKAKEYYRKAITAEYVPAYENLARILLLNGDAKESKEFTIKSLNKFPNSSTLWLTLALAENGLGNYNEALIAAKKAYLISPEARTQNVIKVIENKLYK